MAKATSFTTSKAQLKPEIKDVPQINPSTFTLTFAVELLDIDVWHDCNEGWLDLGPCTQGIKIQYQLYPGQSYDIDCLIWPHAVKIFCGTNYGWVRTWQFLDRRWFTFDIRHVFPVRVVDLQIHVATVNPTLGFGSLGAIAKNDKNTEVYLPPLAFGERRYFARVQETESIGVEKYLNDLIWNSVESCLPASYLDGEFDVPHALKDVRHQDAVLYYVKETILSRSRQISVDTVEDLEVDIKLSAMERRSSKVIKEVKKKVEPPKPKFEIKLSGDTILAGTGRLVPFEYEGERPPELGEFIVLISSNNLPASDDLPIVFVNIDSLFDVPVENFKKLKITQLYTKWSLGEKEHSSEPQFIKHKNEFKFNDHHVVPLPCDLATHILSGFLDNFFEIQLRGIRNLPNTNDDPKFFGYDKKDRDFGTAVAPKLSNDETDFIIATTKINAQSLARGFNVAIKGEYDLFPPSLSVERLEREAVCSNDMNGIRVPVKPDIIVQPYVILDAQMTLQVCMGFVGCRPERFNQSYSRMFCLVKTTEVIMEMLKLVTELNEELIAASVRNDELLTGFALDVGDTVIFYAEGVKDGSILHVWEKTGDFYPHAKPIFSTSSRYSSRIYQSLLNTAVPFVILKMSVPLSALLACPPVYARPALPILTRSAALKLGRLASGKLKTMPLRCEMPTAEELVSFRLELCVPPRPSTLMQGDNSPIKSIPSEISKKTTAGRINWEQPPH